MIPTGTRVACRAAAPCLLALCLAGCITLLPKQQPATLYRFGADTSDAVAAPATGPRFSVHAPQISFQSEGGSDRILTVTGDQTAVIAGVRWVTAASVLFEEAVTRAFDTHGGPARLQARGEPSTADYVLKIDVRSFEARYDHGPRAAPDVVVEVYAALIDRETPTDVRSRVFQTAIPAASNSVHAIVDAFNVGVTKTLRDLVTWVDAKGQA
jgi:cholesterol transport system auxiliary component